MDEQMTSVIEEKEINYDEFLEEQKQIIAEKRQKRKERKRLVNMIAIFSALFVLAICILIYAMPEGKKKSEGFPENKITLPENKVQDLPVKEEKPAATKQEKPSYYKAELEERYSTYSELNPQMPYEDVIWMVNANQDMPKYEFDIPVDGYDNPIIIVNKYYKVPEGYQPPDLQQFDGKQLRRETGEAYCKMRDDAKAEGLRIRVVSGYRSVEYQKGLYNRYLASDPREKVDTYSARAGYSEHHTGMAMDLFGSKDGLREFENTPEYPWVRDNCYKYGFIIRYQKETEEITGYQSEPWHLRYVGIDVSTEMKEKGIQTLEEYCAKEMYK